MHNVLFTTHLLFIEEKCIYVCSFRIRQDTDWICICNPNNGERLWIIELFVSCYYSGHTRHILCVCVCVLILWSEPVPLTSASVRSDIYSTLVFGGAHSTTRSHKSKRQIVDREPMELDMRCARSLDWNCKWRGPALWGTPPPALPLPALPSPPSSRATTINSMHIVSQAAELNRRSFNKLWNRRFVFGFIGLFVWKFKVCAYLCRRLLVMARGTFVFIGQLSNA